MQKSKSCGLAAAVILCVLAAFAGSRQATAQAPTPKAIPATSDVKLVFDDDEQAIIADVREGGFAKISFADAALVASGVTEAPQRRVYLRQLAALEAQATAAVAAAATPIEKGEKLLAWLYGDAGPLAPKPPRKRRNYVATQTRLDVLLDTGTYNCVSATVIYNLIGRRLALDLRAIEVPTHVFSVLRVGDQRLDIETTTARGFNPSRDKKALAEFKELTGFTYIPARSRNKQREIDEAALVSTIFYNRGVDALRSKHFPEAFRFSVLAQRLDPLSASAAGNAEAALARWAGDLARGGDIDRALDIVGQNRGFLADPTAETKVILLAYQARAQELSKQGDTPAVADLYVAARKRHQRDEKLAGRLEHNALAAYDTWAKPKIKAGQWQEAISIYEQGLKALGSHPHIQGQIKFCEQQRKR